MKEDHGDNCKIPQIKKKIAPLEQKEYKIWKVSMASGGLSIDDRTRGFQRLLDETEVKRTPCSS